MGGSESKIEDPNANVVNNIEIVDHTQHLNAIWYLVLITLIISSLNLFLALYKLHKRSLRKKYMSRANDLQKI